MNNEDVLSRLGFLENKVENLHDMIFKVCDVFILAPRMLECIIKLQKIFDENLEKVIKVESDIIIVKNEMSNLKHFATKFREVIERDR